MAVAPIGDGYYDVVTEENHVYTVNLPGGTCTCPDSRLRGARCKHVRRVAIDVSEGRVPQPGQRRADCADCGRPFFVAEDQEDPVYCAQCTLQPGEYVIDRETGDLVVVVRTTDRRAGEVTVPGTDHSIAEHPTNGGYGPDEPLVEVLYPLPVGVEPDEIRARHLKRYSFPRRRLTRRP